MRYISTRGDAESLSFEEVLMAGVADDGGLYIPESMPKISLEEFESWRDFGFAEVTSAILRKFILTTELSDIDLAQIVEKAFSSFRVSNVVKLVELERLEGASKNPRFLLELFHGPTLAFKDVALQVLGFMFEHFLKKHSVNGTAKLGKCDHVIIGATSGDTGSAAIHGLRGKKNIQTFILYPDHMVSRVQELQMTTVMDDNTHTIALGCGFDKCQEVVKMLFLMGLNKEINVSSVNSINLVRIIIQTSYYYYAALDLRYRYSIDLSQKLRFFVPSGNFGDALAGLYAKMMGLPIKSIVMATNKNSSLQTLFNGNFFNINAHKLVSTLSPAMDISLGSNLERILWHSFYDLALESCAEYVCDPKISRKYASVCVSTVYSLYSQTSMIVIEPKALQKLKEVISVIQVQDNEILEIINMHYYSTLQASNKSEFTPLIVDPHTAVGIKASNLLGSGSTIDVCLSTASPAKFPDTIIEAINIKTSYNAQIPVPKDFGKATFTPPEISSLYGKKQKLPITFPDSDNTSADLAARIKKVILDKVFSNKVV